MEQQSVIEKPVDIVVNDAALVKASNFLTQYIRDAGYDVDLEPGTAAYDVLIKPYALLYNLFQQDLVRTKAYLSLDNAVSLKETLGSEFDTVVDSILSNWFITRKHGNKSVGTIRLITSEIPLMLSLTSDSVVGNINGISVHSIEDHTIVETAYHIQTNLVTHRPEYYVDIKVGTLEDASNIIKKGDIVTLELISLKGFKATVLDDFAEGSLKETSEAFIERTAQVINTREMISVRAIVTVLMDKFNDIRNIYIAGHGDFEQLRDIVDFEGISIHVGNKADIYINSILQRKTEVIQLVPDGSGGFLPTVSLASIYPINILSVRPALNTSFADAYSKDNSYNYTILGVDNCTFGSPQYPILLNIPDNEIQYLAPGVINDKVEISYLTNPVVPEVDKYIRGEFQRVTVYNPLVKSKYVVILTFDISIERIHDSKKMLMGTDNEFINELTNSIVDVVNNDVDGVFDTSKVFYVIHKTSTEVVRIRPNISIKYSIFNPDNFQVITGTIPDVFNADTLYSIGVSNQCSENTIQFYTDNELINIRLVD